MAGPQVVAHRGAPDSAPENSMAAFERALDLGADAIELDVRLTRDLVPVVFHYYYLDDLTTASGPIFSHTLEELQTVQVLGPDGQRSALPTLSQVLDHFAGRVGLEIELKGPELEAALRVAELLQPFRDSWPSMEVTSYQPTLLRALGERCPGLAADILGLRSEPWMGLDVVIHRAIHMARLGGARAVHLHPTQLTPEVVGSIRDQGIDVHAWDVNDEAAVQCCLDLDIPRICTDRLALVLNRLRV